MADRLPSDHPSITTVRLACERTPTGLRLEIPDEEIDALGLTADDGFETETVVRVSLDGTEHFARFERALTSDGLVLRGIYETPDRAREPDDETNQLPDWADAHDVDPSRSALLDVIEPGFSYGLRAPGERAVYDAHEPPSDSLAAIARDLETDEPDS